VKSSTHSRPALILSVMSVVAIGEARELAELALHRGDARPISIVGARDPFEHESHHEILTTSGVSRGCSGEKSLPSRPFFTARRQSVGNAVAGFALRRAPCCAIQKRAAERHAIAAASNESPSLNTPRSITTGSDKARLFRHLAGAQPHASIVRPSSSSAASKTHPAGSASRPSFGDRNSRRRVVQHAAREAFEVESPFRLHRLEQGPQVVGGDTLDPDAPSLPSCGFGIDGEDSPSTCFAKVLRQRLAREHLFEHCTRRTSSSVMLFPSAPSLPSRPSAPSFGAGNASIARHSGVDHPLHFFGGEAHPRLHPWDLARRARPFHRSIRLSRRCRRDRPCRRRRLFRRCRHGR
jgi:hypothetical protein